MSEPVKTTEDPKPGTKPYLEAQLAAKDQEMEALKAELEVAQTEQQAIRSELEFKQQQLEAQTTAAYEMLAGLENDLAVGPVRPSDEGVVFTDELVAVYADAVHSGIGASDVLCVGLGLGILTEVCVVDDLVVVLGMLFPLSIQR